MQFFGRFKKRAAHAVKNIMTLLTQRVYGGLSGSYPSQWYYTNTTWQAKPVSVAADRYTLVSPASIQVDVGNVSLTQVSAVNLDLSVAANWDSSTYATAANRAGLDFYVYLCQPVTGSLPVLLLSAAATYPSGYSGTTSRKVGGFHCLCNSAGTISGNTLTGYVTGDILPASVWDLTFRAESSNVGMTYHAGLGAWLDIYMVSGTGASTTSVYGATISDTRSQYDFVDDLAAVKKRLCFDHEFTAAAYGSNEGTNITGSADPNTTGGHSDTAGQRMISNIGCEDCCGVEWQWLNDSLAIDDTNTNTFAWKAVTGSRGQVYAQGTYGFYKLVAGGFWGSSGAYCGSRSRGLLYYAWYCSSYIGARGLSLKRRQKKTV